MDGIFTQSFREAYKADTDPKVLTQSEVAAVSSTLKTWFSVCRKDDSDQARIDQFITRIDRMIPSLKIGIVNEKPVVIAVGEHESTLNLIRYGSSWFEANTHVDSLIMASIS